MLTAFRMSLVSLLLVAGCIAERAAPPDKATDDTSQAVSELSDDSTPASLDNPGAEPQTCAVQICRTVADCSCGHPECIDGRCMQILN
jgi:hypothetical protein